MDDFIKRLHDKNHVIVWKKESLEGQLSYQTEFDNKKARLVVNDFPEEPLFSLIVEGKAYPLDYRPSHWVLEGLIEEKNWRQFST